jgi:NAD(P) transhydrogenase
VGHSEQELTKLRIPYKTGVAKYEETAKGQMMGGPHIDGFLKLLFCPSTHRLLGASAIGDSATEIIHIGQAVMSMGGTIEYFRDSVFNYPTYAELFRIAALDGLNKMGVHGLPPPSSTPLAEDATDASAAATSAESKGASTRTPDAVQRPVPPA